jgi:flagellar basal-body rod modification protein FlgD
MTAPTPVDQSRFEALGLAPATPRRTASNELGQEDFLKLMTAQLKAQDPFNPMESAEFLGQMAQFATVNGIQGLHDAVSALAGSLQSMQALQASSLVGRSVLVASQTAHLPDAGAVQGRVDVPPGASEVTVTLHDSAGEQVQTLRLAADGREQLDFVWDGRRSDGTRAPAGRYGISAQAQVGGTTQALATAIEARVEGVVIGRGGEGLTLNLGGLGSIPAADAVEVR